MKPKATGSLPEPFRATGQDEKSCPVCQARAGASASGSASGSGSGLGPGPGAARGSGSGPSAVLGSGPGLGSASGPGPGPGAAPARGPGAGSVPGPGAESVPGLGAGSVPGLGAGSVPGPGAGSVPGPGAKSVPGTGVGSVPGLGAGSVPELGAKSVLGPGAGSVPGLGAKSVPGPGVGSVPRLGAKSVPGPGARSVPGLGAGSVPELGAKSVLGPGVGSVSGLGAKSVPGPGAKLGAGSVPGPGAKSVPGLGAGSVPGPGVGSPPGPGAKSEPMLGTGPVPGPGATPLPGPGPKLSESVVTPAPASQPKTQAKPTRAPAQKVLVTGGGGYLGFSLGSSLAKSGTSVILLDLRRPQWDLPPGTEFIQADVRDEAALSRAFKGVDCVFHVASYGMSGAEKLQKEQIESINVGGTKLVIDGCVRRRVPRLVYTSTVNVAFGGKPIEQGDEDSVPYFPLEEHTDHYSRTKAIADQLTLMANGTPLPGGGALRTCVLRPPGIYGPGEQRHLPRVASHIKRRLFMFRFGDRRARMNWVHVQNLVQAHVLAAEALTAAKGHVASGQAYYINDGESVNLFEWMAPLFEKLGYSQPWIQVPTSLVYLTATVMEFVHLALRPLCSVPPLLTRSEVQSVAVTHTFRIAKAQAQLGYVPDKFSFADAVERYVQSAAPRPRGPTARTILRRLLALLLLLGLLGLAVHVLGPRPLQTVVKLL